MDSSKSDAIARLGALHYAVLTRDRDAIDKQLRQGADVTARNQDGDTALHMLCYPRKRTSSRDILLTEHQWRMECQQLDQRIVDKLSGRRHLHVRDAAGNAPFMRCMKASGPHFDDFFMFVQMDDDDWSRHDSLEILNNDGEAALDLAFASGVDDFIKTICTYNKGGNPVSFVRYIVS